MPELSITLPRPERWDVPFGEGMTDADVDRLLTVEPFRSVDAAAFPSAVPLRGILRGDARIARFAAGDLIVREGDYGNSAYFILAGSVRVSLDRLPPRLLGRMELSRRTWRQAIAQLWNNAKSPEVRRLPDKGNCLPEEIGHRKHEKEMRVFLQDVPRVLERVGTVRLEAGEWFGELAALTRTPRTATVFAEGAATLLELRWQGLRDLMRFTPAIRHHVERLYRANSLYVHLRETPLLAQLPNELLDKVAAATVFESYGSFDWYTDFHPQRPAEPAPPIEREPVIAAEGDSPSGLLLIRSGFARVSRRYGHGHQTVAYLGRGHVFGLEEFLAAKTVGAPTRWRHSLRAVGYVDILRVPTDVVIESVLPHSPDEPQQVHAIPGQAEAGFARPTGPLPQPAADPRMLEFLSDHRFLNGTQAMLIDLNRCTRCDDCVRACAATHDNNPRFVREGPAHNGVMVANACLHCVDPVCMIGCPTGAIARDAESGTVRINDATCVGCAVCANSCPYQAIRMVEIRAPSGAFYQDEATGQPIQKATKCDFCAEQITGPACQNACPHDALVRIDLSDGQALARWLKR